MSVIPTIVTVVTPWLITLLQLEMFLELLLEWHPVPHHCLLRSLRLVFPLSLFGFLFLCTKTCLVVIVATIVVVLASIVPYVGWGVSSFPI